MYCIRCGLKIQEGMRFCGRCGHCLDDSFPPERKQETVQTTSTSPMRKLTTRQLKRIIAVICLVAVVAGLLIWNPFSLENRLMGKKWWSDIRVNCEYFDYSDSEYIDSPAECGYWVDAYCDSLVFCPYGTIREQDYMTPEFAPSCAYATTYEVTPENVPSWFEWSMGYYRNSGTWEIMSGRRLVLNDNTYDWSQSEDENTWYLSGNTLRIGNRQYTSEDPGLSIINDDVIPYWCANCGEPGPYRKECPNCESKKKTED